MKNILKFIGLAFCLCCFACSDDKVEATLDLSVKELSFYDVGGEDVINVTTSGNWTATSDAAWCRLVQVSGVGSGVVKVEAEVNTTGAERHAQITVSAGKNTQVVKVTQYKETEFNLSETNKSLTYKAQNDTLTVTANDDWTTENKTDWITLTPEFGSAGVTKVVIIIKENPEDQERRATVNFSMPKAHKTQSLTLMQYGKNGSPEMRDSVALVTLFSKIDPEMKSGVWDTGKPISEWYGVTTKTVGVYKRVVALNLDLIGSVMGRESGWPVGEPLPAEIGQMDQVKELILPQLYISGEIPAELGNLVALEKLDLKRNLFSGKIPETFKALTKLKVLNLENNLLNGDLPEFIGEFTDLVQISLGYNDFDRIPDIFGKLTKLKVLNLNSLIKVAEGGAIDYDKLKALNRTFPKSLLGLTNLETINIKYSYFQGSLPESIGMMTGLKSLIAHDNWFSGSLPASLGQIKGLQALNLQENDLSGGIPAEIGECSGLAALILNGNKSLGGTLPVSLAKCTKLQTLEVRACGLSGKLPAGMFETDHFISIDISKNSFEGDLPANIGKQSMMTAFYAQNNAFTSIPEEIFGANSLITLRLENNKIETIPEGLFLLYNLVILNLQDNNITGSIPVKLTGLFKLSFLFLSGNRLSGNVPAELIEFAKGKSFASSFGIDICPQQEGYGLTDCPDRVF